MNIIQASSPPGRFRDILEDLKVSALRESESIPLSLKGWLNSGELDLLNKQALSLSRGCIRHVLYLVLHLGNYLNCHNEGFLNGLICEYRHGFKKALWSLLAGNRECPLSCLQERLEPLDHLLHVIIERLKPSGPYARRDDEIASIYPCPRHALSYTTTIHLNDIRIIRTIMAGRRYDKLSSLYAHLLFLLVMQGLASEGEETGKIRKNQERYRDSLKERLLKQLLKERHAEIGARPASRCGRDGVICYGSVFDLQADEWLIKIASDYKIHMLMMPESRMTQLQTMGTGG